MTTTDTLYTFLDSFRKSLPNTCACTQELGVTLYRTKTIAEIMRYIDPNHPNAVNHLVFDIDRDEGILAWDDNNCPIPNWACVNPDNGHAHLGYSLASPIHFNADSSRRAQRYGSVIQKALNLKLNGDPNYHGNLTKNPLSPYWPTAVFTDTAYELHTLAEHLDLDPKDLDLRRKVEPSGLGRNCSLFDSTRFFAYRLRRKSDQGWLDYSLFEWTIELHALGMNRQAFTIPLGDREVHSIAKSIANWTWNNMSPEGFKLWGDNRRAKSIRVRSARSEVRAERIREVAKTFPELSQPDIAKLVGLSPRTVWAALKGKV